MGQYPDLSEEQKSNFEFMEQLPFYLPRLPGDSDLSGLVSVNEPDTVKPDPVPNHARPVLHDPSLPPVLFRLDSEYPELSNLYHLPSKLKLWGESFKAEHNGFFSTSR